MRTNAEVTPRALGYAVLFSCALWAALLLAGGAVVLLAALR